MTTSPDTIPHRGPAITRGTEHRKGAGASPESPRRTSREPIDHSLPTPDPAAWLHEHGDVLYRYALRRLSHAADAEDAVQETLLAGIRSWDRFHGRSTVRTWLVGIMRHKVLDTLRARATQRAAETASIESHPLESEGNPRTAQADSSPGENAELRAALRAAIDELGSPMREAVLLRVVDGHTTAAVCEALGISREQCWTLVHRAKTKLQHAISGMNHGMAGGTARGWYADRGRERSPCEVPGDRNEA